MWTYTYKHGDRPLDGYTVQRAAGRGGFGEVYYAVSDAGREVALKAITGYEQIELRGIRQCMNLKSPHLVTIFDVRQNEQGRPFVIMEYVNGPNLRQILDDNPAGVGEQKAAFFLREIAKGLSYLHDNGIVHRDLKPANIFFEDGIVKIGDYGLSKAIATTQHSAQTVTVGTVHYMAPEVGQGKYDQGIDIYALGALLYELLTGVVPHVGSTPTEVLMKHLSAEPDLRNVSEPFATAIRRAMAKDPAQRFASVQEMVEAVFGAEHVRQSVSVFSPTDLSMVAGRVARNIGGGAGGFGAGSGGGGSGGVGSTGAGGAAVAEDAGSFTPSSTAPRDGETQDFWNRFARLTDAVGDQLRGGRFSALRMNDSGQPARDPLLPRHRIVMGAVATVLLAIGAGLVTRSSTMLPFVTMAFSLLAAWSGAFAGLIASRLVLPRMKEESQQLQKLASGALIGGAVVVASLPAWATSGLLGGSVIAVAVALACMDVRRWTATDRDERVIWDAAGYAAIIALVLAAIFDGSTMISIMTAVSGVLLMQLLAPWEPPAFRQAKRDPATGLNETIAPDGPAVAAGGDTNAKWQPGTMVKDAAGAIATDEAYYFRNVPNLVRVGWILVTLVLASAAGFLLGYLSSRSGLDGLLAVAGGASCLFAAAIALTQSFRCRYYSAWSYLGRPALWVLCVSTIIFSAIALSHTGPAKAGAMMIIAIVLAAIGLITSFFVRGARMTPGAVARMSEESPMHRNYALMLAAVLFLGVGGLHRFYVGRTVSGVVWLLTFGLFGIGQIVDAIQILRGRFTDAQHRRLLRWDRRDRAVYGAKPTDDAGSTTTNRGATSQTRSMTVKFGFSASAGLNGLLAAVSALLLTGGFILGVAAAVDAPGMVASGVLGDEPRQALAAFWADLQDERGNRVIVIRSDVRSVEGRETAVAPVRPSEPTDAPRPPVVDPLPGPTATVTDTTRAPARRGGSRVIVRSLHPLDLATLIRPEQLSLEELQQMTQYWQELTRELNERLRRQQGGASAPPPAPVPPIASAPSQPLPMPPTLPESVRLRLEEMVSEARRAAATTAELKDGGASVSSVSTEFALPMRIAAAVGSAVCFLLGVTILIFARRSGGGLHLIRGVLGTSLLIASLAPLPQVFDHGRLWPQINTLPRDQALERVAQSIGRGPAAPVSAVLFVSALVTLAWMPRRRTEAATV